MGGAIGDMFRGDGGALTKPALQMPSGDVKFYDSPQARAGDIVNYDVKTLQPNTAELPAQIGDAGPTTFQDNSTAQPQPAKASFREATQDRYGLPNPSNQGLTKLGVLTKFLAGAAQGAATGSQVRGFGQGMQAAQYAPLQLAQARQQVEKGAMESEAARASMQPIQTKFGILPLSYASKLWPQEIKYTTAMDVQHAKGDTAEHVAGTQANSRVAVAQANHRFMAVPGVGLFNTETQQVIPGTQQGITVTPEIAQDYGLPPQFVGKPMKITDLSSLKRAEMFENMPIQTGEGPVVVNRKTGQAKPVVGPGGQTYSTPGVAAALARPYDVVDPTTGAVTPVPAGRAMGTTTPRGGSPAGPAPTQNPQAPAPQGGNNAPQGQPYMSPKSNVQKNAFTPMARFDDINRAVTNVNSALPALDADNTQRALIHQALTTAEAKVGMVRAFVNSKAFKQMNPQSRNYVTGILSLREQIMGANQMLTGSAGTSDSRVQAIWDTLPNGMEPDSDMARRKMEQVTGMIGNLKEAFPLVNVVRQAQQKAAASNPSPSTNPPPQPAPGKAKLPPVAAGYVRFRDSQGGTHDIPKANLDAAKQRDPGLTVF